jgi:myo-inositol 2-dehydrogenase/D-chiro-inositol 1-dehydrogenase
VRRDTDLFAVAYAAELRSFCSAVREGTQTLATGHDARAALAIALAAIDSVRTGAPATVAGSPKVGAR